MLMPTCLDGSVIHNVFYYCAVIEEAKSCPELEAIEWRCRTVDNLAGDTSRMLYAHCVKLQICKACVSSRKLREAMHSYTSSIEIAS